MTTLLKTDADDCMTNQGPSTAPVLLKLVRLHHTGCYVTDLEPGNIADLVRYYFYQFLYGTGDK